MAGVTAGCGKGARGGSDTRAAWPLDGSICEGMTGSCERRCSPDLGGGTGTVRSGWFQTPTPEQTADTGLRFGLTKAPLLR